MPLPRGNEFALKASTEIAVQFDKQNQRIPRGVQYKWLFVQNLRSSNPVATPPVQLMPKTVHFRVVSRADELMRLPDTMRTLWAYYFASIIKSKAAVATANTTAAARPRRRSRTAIKRPIIAPSRTPTGMQIAIASA